MRRTRFGWRGVLGPIAAVAIAGTAASAAALVVSAAPAAAATIHVSDETSFRSAFSGTSFDTIILDSDIHLSVGVCNRARRTTANSPLTVDGQGQFKIVQDCDGFGVLSVTDTSSVTLRGVTITGARHAGDGAGIEFEGTNLTIDHSTFVNNHTDVGFGDDGGGVDFEGTGSLSVVDSTFANNSADDDGGGINCDVAGGGTTGPGSPMTVTGSTFTGNSTSTGKGDSGGAIDMEVSGCSLTLTNSTVTANTSGDDAAVTGERGAGPINLAYDSIVNNATAPASPGSASRAPSAAGKDDTGRDKPGVSSENDTVAVATANVETSAPGTLTIFGTVIARPHGGPNCSNAAGAPLAGITTAGFNFADDTSCGLTASTDKQGAGLDPLLPALANNGGPTQTLLPPVNSPLVNAIPPASCQTAPATGITTDQRGVSRPQGPACDIGAVEVEMLVAQALFTG